MPAGADASGRATTRTTRAVPDCSTNHSSADRIVVKSYSTLWPDGRIRLLAYYATSMSLCRRIWKYWTSKMLVTYILSIICLRLSQFAQLFFMQYMGLCGFKLPIYFVMIERLRVLDLITILKSEEWTICYCLGLGHESMAWALCLSMFLWDIYTRLAMWFLQYQVHTSLKEVCVGGWGCNLCACRRTTEFFVFPCC